MDQKPAALKILVIVAIVILGVTAAIYFINTKKPNKQQDITVSPNDSSFQETPKNRATLEIYVYADKFYPDKLIIKKGSTIKWINQESSPMLITASDSSTETFVQAIEGDDYIFTFEKPGKYEFYNKRTAAIKGTVEVTE